MVGIAFGGLYFTLDHGSQKDSARNTFVLVQESTLTQSSQP